MVKLLRRIINLFKKCKMARINNTAAYAISSPVTADDIVIGSDGGNGGDTKNFQMSDIATYVMSVNTLTLQDVCDNGSATTTGITVAGTTTLNGTLDANSTVDISGNTTIGGTLGVTGASTLDSLSVTNNTTIGGTLGVTGASTLDSVAVTNNATVGGTLGVTGGATFSLGATINGAGLAVNGSGGIVVTDVAGITSFGPVAGTALSSTGGLLVSGTSILGEIDSAGPADIADTLTLSKATGTGLQVDSNAIVDGVLYLNKATGNGLEVTANILVGGSVAAFGTLAGNSLNIAQSTPASASATGITGTIAIDANYIYVCTATDTWKRVAIATW